MSDIVTGGASGGVVAIFILGANWAKSFLSKTPSGSGGGGNGGRDNGNTRELATLSANMIHLTDAVAELRKSAIENQTRIGELAGNISVLTAVIAKHTRT